MGNGIVSVNESIILSFFLGRCLCPRARDRWINLISQIYVRKLVWATNAHLLAKQFQEEEISRRHQMQQTGYQQNNYRNAEFSAVIVVVHASAREPKRRKTTKMTWKWYEKTENVIEICKMCIRFVWCGHEHGHGNDNIKSFACLSVLIRNTN